MSRGVIYVYNQKVEHYVLASALYEKREHLVCVLNLRTVKYPLMEFMNGKFVSKLDTYITKQDELLIINFVNKKTEEFVNKIVLKSREIGCETEFKLKCLDYYSNLQKSIDERTEL